MDERCQIMTEYGATFHSDPRKIEDLGKLD